MSDYGQSSAEAQAGVEAGAAAIRRAFAGPTLTQFLLARIAEDEAATHDALKHDPAPDRLDPPTWFGGDGPAGYGWVILAPERALAECKAKRRIVENAQRHEPGLGGYGASHYAVAALAEVYADHPDYREEWRP